MKVVILAAGIGRSLYPLTKDRPKTLLDVGGASLLERLLTQTTRHGASPIVVVGHARDRVLDLIRRLQPSLPARVQVIDNPLYERTNTLYSLWLARQHCRGEALIVVDGDLICDDAIVDAIMADDRDAVLAIDRLRVMGEEEVKVVCAEDGRVRAIGKALPAGGSHGEFLGLARYSAAAADDLMSILDDLAGADSLGAYYEDAIDRLARQRVVSSVDVSGRRWVEIDFVGDYADALRQFGDAEGAAALAAMPSIRRQLLFCPGPVLVSRHVKRALAAPEIGHRETEFSELLNRTRLKLGRVFGVRNFHRYTTVILTGSGSAANEALLGTAAVGRRLLVLTNGEFGERLVTIARHLGIDTSVLASRWGQPLDLAALERTLAAGGVDAVAWVHHETSTGMLNPIEPIAVLARRYHADTYLDAVSSVGGVPVEVEAHGLTFCTGSANKAIGSVPGLAFVCGRRDAFEALAAVRSRSLYLDLYKHFDYNDHRYQTPNTPAVNLYFALEAALDDLLAEGLERRGARYAALARRLRRGLRRLGLRPFIPLDLMSPLLTTVELPIGFSADEFHDRIKSEGYIVYAGKGILHDRAFQVANIGALKRGHVDQFLEALRRIMEVSRDHSSGDPGRGRRLAAAAAH
jgi:2-aminoethylphosphonate-pyruvate transaminase